MGIMVSTLSWVMQDSYHQPYGLWGNPDTLQDPTVPGSGGSTPVGLRRLVAHTALGSTLPASQTAGRIQKVDPFTGGSYKEPLVV